MQPEPVKAFIYSLPRSGSAWLSMWLTGRSTFCFHEPSSEPESLQDLWESRPEPVVCGVDTGAYIVAPDAYLALKARPYVLWRDPVEVQNSLNECGFPWFDAKLERAKLDAVTLGMRVIYHDRLADVGYRRGLWHEITGGLHFDERRDAAIAGMNVQRDIKKFMARVAA